MFICSSSARARRAAPHRRNPYRIRLAVPGASCYPASSGVAASRSISQDIGTHYCRRLRCMVPIGVDMSFLIVIAALTFLMFAAYRGYSVILFAPVAALGAVLLTDPSAVAPVFSGIFMEKLVGFIKLYFPVFLLGAVFGKVIELSGFSESIVAVAIQYIGRSRANAVIVAVCALLTYGGVSLFVVVFAVYPFAAELYRQSNIPKRLIPGAIALGAFSFTMDALPGTPQLPNIIPTTFFKTTAWAAPALSMVGAAFILVVGLAYLEWRRRAALKRGEGYGTSLVNEPEHVELANLPHPALAIAPRGARGGGQLRANRTASTMVRRRAHRQRRGLPGHRRTTEYTAQKRGRGLGRRRGDTARHLAGRHHRVRARVTAIHRRQQGRGQRRVVGFAQYRIGIRVWRRDCNPPRFRGRQ
ncbi:D-beta-hydroxybutyrate permease (plasmid) [Mycetohabitans rhizoxinica HKI 454]|uniref:D-beta-hydroxybutyrate permease n=1 Tax=Mycetohabitans rhizoxinica (strain DSM 19002 / CIP 109453 / HKI 454) TaxID=882378 RepID=E5AVD9_MYCRK|nr:D-beta-hydroxybutyrate permease [Mycetohabitans rhizoxinica HKI 454]